MVVSLPDRLPSTGIGHAAQGCARARSAPGLPANVHARAPTASRFGRKPRRPSGRPGGCGREWVRMLRSLSKFVLEVLPSACATVIAGVLLSAWHGHFVTRQDIVDPRPLAESAGQQAAED